MNSLNISCLLDSKKQGNKIAFLTSTIYPSSRNFDVNNLDKMIALTIVNISDTISIYTSSFIPLYGFITLGEKNNFQMAKLIQVSPPIIFFNNSIYN